MVHNDRSEARPTHDEVADSLQHLAHGYRLRWPDLAFAMVNLAQELRAACARDRRLEGARYYCMSCPRLRSAPPTPDCSWASLHCRPDGERYVEHETPARSHAVAIQQLYDTFFGLPWFEEAWMNANFTRIRLRVRGDVGLPHEGEGLCVWNGYPLDIERVS